MTDEGKAPGTEEIQANLEAAAAKTQTQTRTIPEKGGGAEKGSGTEPGEGEGKRLVTRSINGRDVTLTVDEWVERGMKGSAADERFREAKAKEKKADRAMRLAEDLEAAKAKDEGAIMRLATYPELGITEKAAREIVEEVRAQKVAEEMGEEGVEVPEEIARLRQELDEVRGQEKSRKNKEVLGAIQQQVGDKLATDPVMGYLLTERPRAFDRLAQFSLGVLQRLVTQEGRRYGPEVLKDAVLETRQYAEELGVVDTGQDEGSVPGKTGRSIPGLGRSPAAVAASRIARGEEPPKRIDNVLDTGDYAKNLHERLVYNALRGGAEEE